MYKFFTDGYPHRLSKILVWGVKELRTADVDDVQAYQHRFASCTPCASIDYLRTTIIFVIITGADLYRHCKRQSLKLNRLAMFALQNVRYMIQY